MGTTQAKIFLDSKANFKTAFGPIQAQFMMNILLDLRAQILYMGLHRAVPFNQPLKLSPL